MTARCTCCDLPVASCGKALEDARRAAAAAERTVRLAFPGWVAAAWPGLCLRCGDRFAAGAPIRSYAQGWSCCGEL